MCCRGAQEKRKGEDTDEGENVGGGAAPVGAKGGEILLQCCSSLLDELWPQLATLCSVLERPGWYKESSMGGLHTVTRGPVSPRFHHEGSEYMKCIDTVQ